MPTEIQAPVGGVVVEVHVKKGDNVSKDDNLFTIELGKTLITVRATKSGYISSISAAEGDEVERDCVVVVIE